MKYIILLMFISTLISCSNKKKLERERFIADSLRNEYIKDSIANDIKNDSLVLIAWGDAQFGMSKKECLNTYAFSKASNYSSSIKMEWRKRLDFMDAFGIEELSDIEALFRGKDYDELSLIEIKSYDVYANKFDDLVRSCNKFKRQFVKIYGNPSSENEVDFLDMNNGEEKNIRLLDYQ